MSAPAPPSSPPPVPFSPGQSQSTNGEMAGASGFVISRSISGVVRTELTGSDIRDRCRDMLYKAMKKHVVTNCEGGWDVRVSMRLGGNE